MPNTSWNRRHASGHRPRRGYLLLAVLVCLVLAGLTLVAIAQRSLETASAAVARQRNLQLQWGAVSCQRTLLWEAKNLFDALDQKAAADPRRRGPVPGELEMPVVLGGLPFHLTLADEDTKANLNSLYHFGGPQQTERFITQQMRSVLRLPVRLRPQARQTDPADAMAAGESLPIAFASWGQVFDLTHAQSLFSGPLPIQQTTRTLTCWGAGRLNLRRAPDEAVLEMCRPVMSDGDTRQMLQSLREDPLRRFERVIEQLGIDPDKQALLTGLLAEQSSCYSLWITVSSGHVRWQQLSISERDDDGVVRTSSFQF